MPQRDKRDKIGVFDKEQHHVARTNYILPGESNTRGPLLRGMSWYLSTRQTDSHLHWPMTLSFFLILNSLTNFFPSSSFRIYANTYFLIKNIFSIINNCEREKVELIIFDFRKANQAD